MAERANLLNMALQFRRHQWHREPLIWIFSNQVYLRKDRNGIYLGLVEFPGECCIFWLDQELDTWYTLRDVERRYGSWAEHAKIWVDLRKGKGAK